MQVLNIFLVPELCLQTINQSKVKTILKRWRCLPVRVYTQIYIRKLLLLGSLPEHVMIAVGPVHVQINLPDIRGMAPSQLLPGNKQVINKIHKQTDHRVKQLLKIIIKRVYGPTLILRQIPSCSFFVVSMSTNISTLTVQICTKCVADQDLSA